MESEWSSIRGGMAAHGSGKWNAREGRDHESTAVVPVTKAWRSGPGIRIFSTFPLRTVLARHFKLKPVTLEGVENQSIAEP